MGIKTVPLPPYSPVLALCDFWLFPKLRGCRYERIEEMKEAVTKVIDTLTQEDFHWAFQRLLERYNKCIAAGGDYFDGDLSVMCVLSIKVPIRIKSGKLFNDPRIYIYIYIYIYIQGCVLPKTLKMVLDTTLLNTQQYMTRVKGKVDQSGERRGTLPYTSL